MATREAIIQAPLAVSGMKENNPGSSLSFTKGIESSPFQPRLIQAISVISFSKDSSPIIKEIGLKEVNRKDVGVAQVKTGRERFHREVPNMDASSSMHKRRGSGRSRCPKCGRRRSTHISCDAEGLLKQSSLVAPRLNLTYSKLN